MANTIVCPHCQKSIELTQALTAQLQEEITRKTEERLRKELQEQTSIELEDLRRQLAEKEEKVSQMREAELALREEKRRLEEKEKELALEVERRIDEEKKKIEQAVLEQAAQQHRLKDLEKDKVINDLKTALEEAQRKATQGSQQLQGEVLELDIEHLLQTNFPGDEIEPVGKGVRGADIKHIIKNSKGSICGVILWEMKRTKAWSDEWCTKLKEDLRAAKAHVPVIVSSAFPKEIENSMGLYDGVWVIGFNLVLPVATLLRKNLIAVEFQKQASADRGTKADLLYAYVMGHEFRQQVEALAEVYREMQDQILRERTAFEKSWKTREAQLKRLVLSTANIYGSMQGLVGSSMPQVKGLELLGDGE